MLQIHINAVLKFLSSSLMNYIAESKNAQEMIMEIITELIGLVYERWQSLEVFPEKQIKVELIVEVKFSRT